MTEYNQRDIVLVPFPYSDLTGAKQRPALIISNEHVNNAADRICCLITSNLPKGNGLILTEQSFEQGKLPFQSWVKPHRLFTIHHNIIRKKLCTITKEHHSKIIKEINRLIQ